MEDTIKSIFPFRTVKRFPVISLNLIKLKKFESMDAKTKAIVAHITLIGWIVAIVINSNQKEEFASFYIRQYLGIMLMFFAAGIVGIVPVIGWITAVVLWVGGVVFWVMSLISAIQGETKEVPLVGKYFQDWFKGM